MLMLLPIVPTVILMVSPIRTQLWQYTVPFLAQNQMLLKVIRSETIAPLEWAVYFGAGFGLAALLWFAATRRYHQERLAISACGQSCSCTSGFSRELLPWPLPLRRQGEAGRKAEARRVGKECVSTWKSRWAPYH